MQRGSDGGSVTQTGHTKSPATHTLSGHASVFANGCGMHLLRRAQRRRGPRGEAGVGVGARLVKTVRAPARQHCRVGDGIRTRKSDAERSCCVAKLNKQHLRQCPASHRRAVYQPALCHCALQVGDAAKVSMRTQTADVM